MSLSKMTLPLAALLLCSCSPGRAPAPAPAAPQKNVLDPLMRDLDRARGAQESVDRNSAATGNAIDAAEGGDSPPR